MSQLTPEQRNTLRTNIADHFGLEELKKLCFDLGVDYDDLAGEGKGGKVIALIKWFEERNLIRDLIRKCREERPNVGGDPWPGAIAFGSCCGSKRKATLPGRKNPDTLPLQNTLPLASVLP